MLVVIVSGSTTVVVLIEVTVVVVAVVSLPPPLRPILAAIARPAATLTVNVSVTIKLLVTSTTVGGQKASLRMSKLIFATTASVVIARAS